MDYVWNTPLVDSWSRGARLRFGWVLCLLCVWWTTTATTIKQEGADRHDGAAAKQEGQAAGPGIRDQGTQWRGAPV